MSGFPDIDLSPLPAIGSGAFLTERSTDPDDRLVSAETDSEIARAFLYHAELASTTLKSTKTELARFLLWCMSQQKTLSMLRVEDLTTYKGFLRDPQPAEDWISPTRWPRADARWRPFAGPLSDQSARQAFRVAKALLTFATDAGLLRLNAGSLVKNIRAPAEARVTRYLDAVAIDYVYAAIDALPAITPAAIKAKMRDRFLLVAYLTTGARLSEIVGASMGSVFREPASITSAWWLDIVGKGSKPRRLPVAPELLAAYKEYRTAFGLPAVSARADKTPLVVNARGKQIVSISDEAASIAVKRLFCRAADLADRDGHTDAAAALRSASAHWLRHTMLTTLANNGVPLKVLQDTAGHASLTTTSKYLHTEENERHAKIISSLDNEPVENNNS